MSPGCCARCGSTSRVLVSFPCALRERSGWRCFPPDSLPMPDIPCNQDPHIIISEATTMHPPSLQCVTPSFVGGLDSCGTPGCIHDEVLPGILMPPTSQGHSRIRNLMAPVLKLSSHYLNFNPTYTTRINATSCHVQLHICKSSLRPSLHRKSPNLSQKELSCQHHYHLVESWCPKYIETQRRCPPTIAGKQYW